MYYSANFPEHEKASNSTTKVRHISSGLSKFEEARALNSLVLEDASSRSEARQVMRDERERAVNSARLRQREREETDRIVKSAAAYRSSSGGEWREEDQPSWQGQPQAPYVTVGEIGKAAELNAEFIRGTEKLRINDSTSKETTKNSYFLIAEQMDEVAAQNEAIFSRSSAISEIRMADEAERRRREALEYVQRRGSLKAEGAEDIDQVDAHINAQTEKIVNQRLGKVEGAQTAALHAKFAYVDQLRERTERIKERRLAAEHEERWSNF
jgi:hypothetical protein